jgi:hypothetical protein
MMMKIKMKMLVAGWDAEEQYSGTTCAEEVGCGTLFTVIELKLIPMTTRGPC